MKRIIPLLSLFFLISCTKEAKEQSIIGSWYHTYGETHYLEVPKFIELSFRSDNTITLTTHMREAGDYWSDATGTYTRNGDQISFDLSFDYTTTLNSITRTFTTGEIYAGPQKPLWITVKIEKTDNKSNSISTESLSFFPDRPEL